MTRKMKGNGLLWWFGDKQTVRQGLEEAIIRYRMKFVESPALALMSPEDLVLLRIEVNKLHPQDPYGEVVRLFGVLVEEDGGTLLKHVLVGMAADE